MAQTKPVHPPTMWAQASGVIYITYNVECKQPIVTIKEDSIFFEGTCLPDNVPYMGTINLHGKILPDKSSWENKGRCIQLILQKEVDNAPFWPRLTVENHKHHWLRVDFSKLEDDPDSSDERAANGIDNLMRQMRVQDKPDFDEPETDSDDECLPDLTE